MMQVMSLRRFVIAVVLGALVIIMLREPSFCESVRDTIQPGEFTVLCRTAAKTSEGKYSCACFPEQKLRREELVRKLAVLTI